MFNNGKISKIQFTHISNIDYIYIVHSLSIILHYIYKVHCIYIIDYVYIIHVQLLVGIDIISDIIGNIKGSYPILSYLILSHYPKK